jgi:hypothetical protein
MELPLVRSSRSSRPYYVSTGTRTTRASPRSRGTSSTTPANPGCTAGAVNPGRAFVLDSYGQDYGSETLVLSPELVMVKVPAEATGV